MMMTPPRDSSAPHAAMLSMAAIATTAILGFVIELVGSSSSPWLPADSEAIVAPCDGAPVSTPHLACLHAAATPQAHVVAR